MQDSVANDARGQSVLSAPDRCAQIVTLTLPVVLHAHRIDRILRLVVAAPRQTDKGSARVPGATVPAVQPDVSNVLVDKQSERKRVAHRGRHFQHGKTLEEKSHAARIVEPFRDRALARARRLHWAEPSDAVAEWFTRGSEVPVRAERPR